MKYVPESPTADLAERHVVAQDLDLLAVFDQRGQRVVGVASA